MTATELQPLRPRRASAATVRRHRKYLTYRLREVAPGADRLLIVPVPVDDGVTHVVRAYDRDGALIRIGAGQNARLASRVRAAFPCADWSQSVTWRAGRGACSTSDLIGGAT